MQLLNEYRDVFAKNLSELGCTDFIKVDLIENPNSIPVTCYPYKTSPNDRQYISAIMKEWKESGIITETHSPYASPVLLVNKSTGDKRLCIDYRKLNKQLVDLPYPMPDIDEELSTLSQGKVFATLDLSNGYLQVPLSEAAKQKTAFITPDETAQFERLPFGLKNAPAVFWKLMFKVFHDLRNNEVLRYYLDDMIIPASDWEDLIRKLRLVFNALRAAKLTLKPSKCNFGKTVLEFLGFQISVESISPGKKASAIGSFSRPSNVHDIRRFLGLAGFFRRFIYKYAHIAEPLTRLTKKNERFQWTEAQEIAFNELKRLLISKPILRLFNPDLPVTEVHTDACADSLAGMLLQGDLNTPLHMVYCVSKKTTPVERQYHSSRLELMAIVWTLKRLRAFLMGRKFVVCTDCQALVYLNENKTSKHQIARWFDILQEFDFEVRYRPGTRMAHVDAMSRAPVEEADSSADQLCDAHPQAFTLITMNDRVAYMQQGDEATREVVKILMMDVAERNKRENGIVSGFKLRDGILYRNVQGKDLFVVPKSMRKGLVIAAHELSGHFAVDRTVQKLQKDFWFAKMRRYVKQHIKMCIDCLVSKRPGGKRPGLLHPIPPGPRPFSLIHVDHVGPFETTKK